MRTTALIFTAIILIIVALVVDKKNYYQERLVDQPIGFLLIDPIIGSEIDEYDSTQADRIINYGHGLLSFYRFPFHINIYIHDHYTDSVRTYFKLISTE